MGRGAHRASAGHDRYVFSVINSYQLIRDSQDCILNQSILAWVNINMENPEYNNVHGS